MHRMPIPWLISLSVALCFSCTDSGSTARYHYLQEQREAFVFQAPPEKIFAEVQRLLAEEGHPLEGTVAQAVTGVSTPWKQENVGSSQFQVRFIPLERGGHFVHIVHLTRFDSGEINRLRWTDMEWELVQRVEPDRAAEILQRANQRGEDVHARRQRLGC